MPPLGGREAVKQRGLLVQSPGDKLNSSKGSARPCSASMQYGPTAEKLQTFLAAHRPSSPSSRSRPSTPSSPPAPVQQLSICTADDALQHYVEHGLDAVPKLVHCIPAAASQDTAWQEQLIGSNGASSSSNSPRKQCKQLYWEPSQYELQVVQRSQLPPCYYTVSAAGVVHAPGNGYPSVHTPIGQWVRDGNMFKLFRGLPAFRQLWQGHTLRRWHANVRRIVYERNRQQLAKQLLILKPPYLKMLNESRGKLAAVQEAGALQPMPAGLYKLETLVETQQEYQSSKLAPLLARTIAGIISEVENLASRLQNSEQLLRRELYEYNKDPSAGATQGLSPIKIRAERDAVAAKHAAALYDLQRLPALLRLLGLHVLQSYLDLLVGAVSGLKAHLEAPDNALIVNILLAQNGVALSPSMEELLKGLSKDILEHLVHVLKAAPRPLRHPVLAALLDDPIKPVPKHAAGTSTCGARHTMGSAVSMIGGLAMFQSDAGSVARVSTSGAAAGKIPLPAFLEDDDQSTEGGMLLLMMVGDQNLGLIRRAMDQQVMRTYREASVVTDTLAELSVLLSFARVWDATTYKAKQHTVAQLRRDMQLLREWQAQLQVVLDHQSVGLLQLQTAFLKTTYMAKLASAQATIAMLLVSAARRECQTIITELHSLAKELGLQPSKLVEFIAFKLRVKDVWQSREQMAGLRPAQVQEMYGMAAEWAPDAVGKIPHADQVLSDDLKEAVRTFNRALTAAMAFIDSRQMGMMALLDRHAKEQLKNIQELLKQLEVASMAQRLGSSAAGLAVTADKISTWQQQIQQFGESVGVINQQEVQLGCKQTYYADLEEVKRVLKEIELGRG